MRIIGILEDEKKGLTFSSFLHQKEIAHQLEMEPNYDWGSADYGSSQCKIWIHDEDQVEQAIQWLTHFKENPSDPIFHFVQPISSSSFSPSPISNPEIEPSSTRKTHGWETATMGWITRSFLILCSILFATTQLIKPSVPIPANTSVVSLVSSPIDQTLLYDYPLFYELINRFIDMYGYEGLKDPTNLTLEAQILLQKIHHTPFWKGFYEEIFVKNRAENALKGDLAPPLFEKIREGQIWRLFSPALLHGDIFHLFFNMLWLMVLGKQLELRLKASRYLLFILITGIFSNTSQYLMSGSNFVGFSGILCAMLTFIWIRQNQTPWEGYQLDRLSFSFMMFFIIGMALLQLVSLFLEKFFQIEIAPNIANTAHLSGALIGIILGRLDFFSWSHS